MYVSSAVTSFPNYKMQEANKTLSDNKLSHYENQQAKPFKCQLLELDSV